MYLQKKRKYGAVVTMITTAMMSSSCVKQAERTHGIIIIRMHEHRNITREGAVI